jgi:outer membrane protein insertion porin family
VQGPPAASQGQEPGKPVGPGLGSGDQRWDAAVRAIEERKLPVRSILVLDCTRDTKGVLLDDAAAGPLVRSLETRVGQPFRARLVTADCTNLWSERRLVVTAAAEEVEGEVVVRFLIDRRVEVCDGVEFRGLTHFDRATADALLGITAGRQVTRTEAEAMRKVLLARYQRDGYAFCTIRVEERQIDAAALANPPRGGAPQPADGRAMRALFWIDEGPVVRIRNLQVLGNQSFAAEPMLGMFGTGDYLLRESHLKSEPARGWASGGPYSRELLEEDLDRLRLFYRSNGYLDATVDIANVVFAEDRTRVDLALLVVEGPRYRLASVRVDHVDARGEAARGQPRYSREELQGQIECRAGDFYSDMRLRRDWLRLQEFYGRRGHPPSSFPGMKDDPNAFQVLYPPLEIYHADDSVEVVFQVCEGQPRQLRDVVIRGNQFTRDAVIRSRVRVLPGERIDMKEVERTQRNLDQTRYFQDPTTMRGPRLQLEPVAGQQDLNLGIDAEDGSTGEFRWGLSYGSGVGPQGNIVFNKRNFDLYNPPSSFNPITAVGELIDNTAFHGGGQMLGLFLAPGLQTSQYRVSWSDPDAFGMYQDPLELRLAGQRLIRRLPDGYTQDTFGGEVGLARRLSDEWTVGLSLREDSVRVRDLAGDATSLAYAAEGRTELRGLRLNARYTDLDDFRRPSEGFEIGVTGEVVGGFLGGEESLVKLVHTANWYLPLRKNELGHRTVLRLEHYLGLATGFGGSDQVFLTERFYMGAYNLRGFGFRRAGPTQFGRPYGGEAMYTATAEIGFPLVPTRLPNEIRDRELMRWVLFTDLGLLGLSVDDPTFGQVRGSYGVGLRIEVPYLEWPIQLDLAWPWRHYETDDRRQFYFTFGSR